MLFTSVAFGVFLAVVIPLFFLLPQRFRPTWIVLVSFYFYTYETPEYWWLLFGCIVVSYVGGLAIAHWQGKTPRRVALAVSVTLIAGLLVYYKYAHLLLSTINAGLSRVSDTARVPDVNPLLPIGISFFTFQALSYLFDVYWKKFPVEKRFDVFAAYKAFFPQLVAGPIERPGHVIPQLVKKHVWNNDRFISGLKLMLWGFFKKLVIADRLAIIVNEMYAAPADHNGFQLLIATYAFAWQIFCDFSAYTDIARGCARILGIDLMENFRQPYLAKSIPEFWQRWHISLSTWFRDYLYIPLGGNRTAWLRWQANLLIVFLVSGIWHGADWKFAIWGAIHGALFILVNAFALVPRPKLVLPKWGDWLVNGFKIFVTFNIVCFAWIFFRANSMGDALTIIQKIAAAPFSGVLFTEQFDRNALIIMGVAIVLLEGVHIIHRRTHGGIVKWLDSCPIWVRWPAYYALVAAIFLLTPKQQQGFIYFQF